MDEHMIRQILRAAIYFEQLPDFLKLWRDNTAQLDFTASAYPTMLVEAVKAFGYVSLQPL